MEESKRCEHRNTRTLGCWVYCLDCCEVLMKNSTLCRHNKLKSHNSWVRCEDCGEVLFRDGDSWFLNLDARNH
jgi:hypothetical protein